MHAFHQAHLDDLLCAQYEAEEIVAKVRESERKVYNARRTEPTWLNSIGPGCKEQDQGLALEPEPECGALESAMGAAALLGRNLRELRADVQKNSTSGRP